MSSAAADRSGRTAARYRADPRRDRQASCVSLCSIRCDVCAPLAEACASLGRIDEAMTVLDESLPFAETEQHYYEAELHRLRGELSLMQTVANREGAKRCFCRAIDIGRRQRARSWELPGTPRLVRLRGQQATPRGAHDASLDLRLVHRTLRYPRSD